MKTEDFIHVDLLSLLWNDKKKNKNNLKVIYVSSGLGPGNVIDAWKIFLPEVFEHCLRHIAITLKPR